MPKGLFEHAQLQTRMHNMQCLVAAAVGASPPCRSQQLSHIQKPALATVPFTYKWRLHSVMQT